MKRYFKRSIPSLDAHKQRQYRILFSTWFAGSGEAQIASVLCTHCGFVGFIPRPKKEDVNRKYEVPGALGRSPQATDPDNKQDRKSAHLLFRDLNPYLKPGSDVLDYGGNDGRLALPFLEAGHNRYLIDYKPHSVPGVMRLASTLDQLQGDRRFDAIVLNHVLEHVAEPSLLLASLRARLANGGIMYLKVPMELWRRLPLGDNLLTHLNFFTPPVVERLLKRTGFSTLSCKLKGHHTMSRSLAVRAIAQRADDSKGESPIAQQSAGCSSAMIQSTLAALQQVVRDDWKRAAFFLTYAFLRGIYRRLKLVQHRKRQ